MTTEEYNEIIKSMNEFGERLRKDPVFAKEFLKKTGIYNPDGTIHENYGGEPYRGKS